MKIVPVIDLKQGQVVHARMGDRARYAPIRSRLCDGSDPLAVVSGLLGLYPFGTLYVADLDAIAGGPGHDRVLEGITARFPALRLWVDRGTATTAHAEAWLARGIGDLVLGSESLAGPEPVAALAASRGPRIVLSLDFRGDAFQGPKGLLDRPADWPSRIIAMTLGRVGSGTGPDLARLDAIMRLAGADRQVFAAGGVRDAGDLRNLATRKAAGALVATALHDGRLAPSDLASFAQN